jgi:hypothetical protein
MIFDLNVLLQRTEGLQQLETPFTRGEIDGILARLPNDKSPRPDGYNNEFTKGCWFLIAPDFYKLCDDFYDGEICLGSINSSYITLIPKKDGPKESQIIGPFHCLTLL